VKKRRIRRKSDQDYWEPFAVYLRSALKAHNVAFKVPAEVWLGLPFLAVIGAFVFRLGASPNAWNKNWWKVVLLIVVGELLLFIIRPVVRFAAALREVCREERFRDISRDVFRLTIVLTLLVALWGAEFWYDIYIHSTHFHVNISRVGLADIYEHNPSCAIELLLDMNNTGVPSRIRSWGVAVIFTNGEVARADTRLTNSHLWVRKIPNGPETSVALSPPYDEDIVARTRAYPVGSACIHGNIAFQLTGYKNQVVAIPGNLVELSFVDEKGSLYKFTYPVTGETAIPDRGSFP
jgi:hypothetical protein